MSEHIELPQCKGAWALGSACGRCPRCLSTLKEVPGIIRDLLERANAPRPVVPILDELRAMGWTVAGHNDYTLHGAKYTFWLLTHTSGIWVRGEGLSDEVALNRCKKQIDKLNTR